MVGMALNEFQVTGMSCGHCEAAVREEVAKLDGVRHIEVSAASGRLVISADAPLEERDVVAAVSEAGYSAVAV
jgi:copper chaperone